MLLDFFVAARRPERSRRFLRIEGKRRSSAVASSELRLLAQMTPRPLKYSTARSRNVRYDTDTPTAGPARHFYECIILKGGSFRAITETVERTCRALARRERDSMKCEGNCAVSKKLFRELLHATLQISERGSCGIQFRRFSYRIKIPQIRLGFLENKGTDVERHSFGFLFVFYHGATWLKENQKCCRVIYGRERLSVRCDYCKNYYHFITSGIYCNGAESNEWMYRYTNMYTGTLNVLITSCHPLADLYWPDSNAARVSIETAWSANLRILDRRTHARTHARTIDP